MTIGFSFDANKSFDENFEAFLEATKVIDEELAGILRDNAAALAQIVSDGERDSSARTTFNDTIAAALDELVAPQNLQGGE